MRHEWEVWRSRTSRAIGGRLGVVAVDASVDTGYRYVRAECDFALVVGPWRWSFRWAFMDRDRLEATGEEWPLSDLTHPSKEQPHVAR